MILRSLRSFRLVLALFAVVAFLAMAPAAGAAQVDDCYPDGCTPPTEPPPAAQVSCELDAGSAAVGAEVAVSILNAGSGTVRLLLDGTEVARSTAPSTLRRLPAQADVRSLAFVAPEVEPGTYSLVAVGDAFSVECSFGANAGFEVLTDTRVRSGSLELDGAAAGTGTGARDDGGFSGALAFTGANLVRLAVFAVVAIVLGAVVVRATRRRRLARL